MDETVHTAQVHEHTVVGDVLDHAFQHLTLLQLGDELCAFEFLFGLQEGFVRNNHVAEFLIDFHNLEVHGGIYEYVVVTDGLDVDLGAREESLDTEHVHDHTALGAGLDIALHHFAALVSSVYHIPRLELTRLLVGDDELTFAVLSALNEHFHLITDLEVRVVAEFGSRDDTFALGADVHHYFAFVDGGDHTFHHFVFSDLGEGLLVLGKSLFLGALVYAFVFKGIPIEVLGSHRGVQHSVFNFFRHKFLVEKTSC